MKMKVEILARELIKPYTDTPPCFRNYNISLIDEISPNMFVPAIFYYQATDQDDAIKTTLTYENLKKSLSKVLAIFHPFAGRYRKESRSIDCSDQGVEFVEAKVDIHLDDLLSQRKNLKVEVLNDLLPCPLGAVDEYTDPLLAVQVSAFRCGGIAIAVCSSHRIADMTTTISFVKAWAIAAKKELGCVDENYLPTSWNFDSAFLFPVQKLPCLSGLSRDKENIEVHKIVTKIFYFSESKILSIRERAKVDNSSKILPTKVQSVFGIIGKAIIDRHVANPENSKGYVFIQAVNMRARTVPPLPKDQCGNLYLISCAQSVAGHDGVGLPGIVDCLSNSVKRTADKCSMVLSLEKEGKTSLSQDLSEVLKSLSSPEIYFAGTFSSWCKFPFYETDFGWGKPMWVSGANIGMKNLVVLIDEKSGGGIEAWVSLNESDMENFIKHSEITDSMDCN